ncbi:MAG TPA: hypothetical protein VMV81_14160, partial [Phycisphaerae bacterium]|nr:hypothetical protein [Phycisphaerae bacterium]
MENSRPMCNPSVRRLTALLPLICAICARADVALHIESAKSGPYVLAEPVVITATLTNQGPETISISRDLRMISQMAQYFVSTDGQKFSPIGVDIVYEQTLPGVTLRPTEFIRNDEMIIYDGTRADLAFPRPGTYFLRMTWVHPDTHQETNSNIIQVEVVKPTGDLIKPSATLGQVLTAKTLQGQYADPIRIQQLKAIATSKTLFAPYAALWLAREDLKGDEVGLPLNSAAEQFKSRAARAAGWLRIA